MGFMDGIKGMFGFSDDKKSGKFKTAFPTELDSDDEKSTAIRKMFDDADRWRNFNIQQLSFSLNQSNTTGRNLGSARVYWEYMRYLEDGNHYAVYDTRKNRLEDDWKHELVDNEIGNQIRVRKAYVNANFHNISVLPNIDNIDAILDAERRKIDWEFFITDVASQGLTEGTAWAKSYVDSSCGDVQVKHILLDNECVFLSPGARNKHEAWYLIVGSIHSKQDVHRLYPDFTFNDITTVDIERYNRLTPKKMATDVTVGMIDNENTQFVDVLECWMDDVTMVAKEFDAGVVDGEHSLLEELVDPTKNEGIDATSLPQLVMEAVPVHDTDNHKKHIEAHKQYIEALNLAKTGEPNADGYVDLLTLAIQHHINLHELAIKENPEFASQRKKYPYGRRVVVIGGKVAEDVVSEYESDWRDYFNVVYNERMPKNAWGRGLGHTLYHTNHIINSCVSRIMDSAITTANPKPWLHAEDKDLIEKNNYTNDPLKPAFYRKNAPAFPSASSPRENMELYNVFKSAASKQQGVNDVTYGDTIGSGASGVMVDTLQRQNAILVTGEFNSNLNKFVECVMKAHILLMKQFYTSEKIYFVNGKAMEINVSELLRYEVVTDEESGQQEVKEIPVLDVRVKANSNLPNQWEYDFNFILKLATMTTSDGRPILPLEAVLDYVKQRYPDLGVDGKYYQMSQAMQVGMQVLQQQQMQQQQMQSSKKNEQLTMNG